MDINGIDVPIKSRLLHFLNEHKDIVLVEIYHHDTYVNAFVSMEDYHRDITGIGTHSKNVNRALRKAFEDFNLQAYGPRDNKK